jgi:FdhD protein
MTAEYEVLSIDGDAFGARLVRVCREERIHLWVNGALVATLAISPHELAEFGCGYCITEGIVQGIHAVQEVKVSLPDIRVKATAVIEDALSRGTEILTSGCKGVIPGPLYPEDHVPPGIVVPQPVIFSAMERLNDHAVLWRSTGGTHCTVIYDAAGNAVSQAEDVGRHNSVDKAIGKALLSGVDLGQTFLACSGRMPEGMVRKIYRAGIRLIVTNNAPSAAGIDLARQVGLTLAGFVRPPRMNIYSRPERIALEVDGSRII